MHVSRLPECFRVDPECFSRLPECFSVVQECFSVLPECFRSPCAPQQASRPCCVVTFQRGPRMLQWSPECLREVPSKASNVFLTCVNRGTKSWTCMSVGFPNVSGWAPNASVGFLNVSAWSRNVSVCFPNVSDPHAPHSKLLDHVVWLLFSVVPECCSEAPNDCVRFPVKLPMYSSHVSIWTKSWTCVSVGFPNVAGGN